MTTPEYLKGYPDAPYQHPDTESQHMANAKFLMGESARHTRIAAWSMGLVGFGIILAVTARLLSQ